MSLQLPGATASQSNIPSTAPSGATGIDMTQSFPYDIMRPDKWLITAVVTSAPSDLFIWGAVASGVALDATDDVWGLHSDKYGAIKDGKLGTALAVGTHHFVVTDIGVYARVYFQKSAGAITVTITPILTSRRSS